MSSNDEKNRDSDSSNKKKNTDIPKDNDYKVTQINSDQNNPNQNGISVTSARNGKKNKKIFGITRKTLKRILCFCPKCICFCYSICLGCCCLQSLCKPPHSRRKKLGICPPFDILQLLAYLWFILHPLSVFCSLMIFSSRYLFISGFTVRIFLRKIEKLDQLIQIYEKICQNSSNSHFFTPQTTVFLSFLYPDNNCVCNYSNYLRWGSGCQEKIPIPQFLFVFVLLLHIVHFWVLLLYSMPNVFQIRHSQIEEKYEQTQEYHSIKEKE